MKSESNLTLLRRRQSNRFSMKSTQDGATLIVVLVILILVTSIGIVAIRSSNTSLKISTAEQIDGLKFRANDAALIKVEKEDRSNTASAARDRLKGYMTSSEVEDGEEVTFCLRPSNKSLFKLTELTVKTADGQTYANKNNGYCDPTKATDYTNEGRTITQLTFVKQSSEAIFDQEEAGTGSNNLKINGVEEPKCSTIKGYITSVIPAVSTASQSEIAECLKKGYRKDSKETVDSCLTDKNVTHETQIQVYKNIPIGYKCV